MPLHECACPSYSGKGSSPSLSYYPCWNKDDRAELGDEAEGRQDTVREKREVRGRVWVGKGWVHTTSSVGLWSVGGACEW